MDEKPQTDASDMADQVLGQEEPPFHPPVEAASESAETSVAREGEATDESPN